MSNLNSLWLEAEPLVDKRDREWLLKTLQEIGDSESPSWGSWSHWLKELKEALTLQDRAELSRVIRRGYLRVRFYHDNRNEPPLESEKDLESFVVHTAGDLERRLEKP